MVEEAEVERWYREVEECLRKKGLWEKVIRRFPPNALRTAVKEILERFEARGMDPHLLDWCTAFSNVLDYPSINAFIQHLEEAGEVPPPPTMEELDSVIRSTVEELLRLKRELLSAGKVGERAWRELRERLLEVAEYGKKLTEYMSKASRASELEAMVRRLKQENRRLREELMKLKGRKEVKEYGPSGTESTRCPAGEEPVPLEWVRAFLSGSAEAQYAMIDYIRRNWYVLFPGRGAPPPKSVGEVPSPRALQAVKSLIAKLAGGYPNLYKVLKELADRYVAPSVLRYVMWCPATNQLFELRAYYRRGKYVEELRRVLTEGEVLRRIARELGEQVVTTPSLQAYVIKRAGTGSGRPFGLAPVITGWQYLQNPGIVIHELAYEIGDKCLVCGTDVRAFIPGATIIDGTLVQLIARCPVCKVIYWWIPQLKKWGIVYPTNVENLVKWGVWKPEWLNNLRRAVDELKKKGWTIGPYRSGI